MYASFFGLARAPFSIAPDPRYLYMSERHREALAHLLYGVGGGGGFVLLTGEIGAGKTTVCRCFLEQVPATTQVAYIFNPKLTVLELLATVCHEFGLATPSAAVAGASAAPTIKDYVDALNRFLLHAHAAGRNSLLVIDEAQNLSADVLEQLRLLTNLETSERKLLQIVLIGQPELRTMLEQPELEQLAQRVIARYHLDALSAPETTHYIAHRLGVAGLRGPLPFDARALRRIHALTGGVPRRINLLCDRALLGAYATGQTRIEPGLVDRAAREVFGPRAGAAGTGHGRRRAWRAPLAMAATLGAGLLAAGAAWEMHERFAGGPGGARGHALAAALPRSGAAASQSSTQWPSQSTAPSPSLSPSQTQTQTQTQTQSQSQSQSQSVAILGAPPASGPTAFPRPAAPSSSASRAADGPPGVGPAAVPAGSDAVAAVIPLRMRSIENLQALLAYAPPDDRDVVRQLAPAWQLQLPPGTGDPCAQVRQQAVECLRAHGGLDLLRRLARPAALGLRDAHGRPAWVLLAGLDSDAATLQVGAQALQVSPTLLTSVWRGEFTTLWRIPPGYVGPLAEGARGPAVADLGARLAVLQGASPPAPDQPFDARLKARVAAFQVAQGLDADGVAGPTTLMQLNRSSGAREPWLAGAASSPAASRTQKR